ncbi:tetratricopeptide repeat protein [Flagellimonas eckloniae]|uniref:Uncharacterized protein n=1 Tax=Flagellimonas eckloniae TaxID=346185 RepID=A0A0Q1H950_9FLAO|nr:tetratricopeptide repeat protein [Allomuricauda eckloniae]KQC30192.1 hypothetical protein AAY42_10120 [Allomuricauda eckloniae]
MKYLIFTPLFLIGLLSFGQTADEYLELALQQHKENPITATARTYFHKALKLEPNNEKVLYEFAMYNIDKKAYDKAQDLLTKLLDIAEDNPNYYWQRIRVLVRPNSLDEELLLARRDLEKAISLGYNDKAKIKQARELIDKYLN